MIITEKLYLEIWGDICYYSVNKDIINFEEYLDNLALKYNTKRIEMLQYIKCVKKIADENIKKYNL